MDWFLLIITVGLISLVWFLFSALCCIPGERTSDHVLATSTFLTAQIILSQILLGQIGRLNLNMVIAVNLFFSGVVFAVVWFNTGGRKRIFEPFIYFLKVIRRWWKEVKGWENNVMILITGLLVIWLGTAAYLFPPRGIDDMYHLPPVFQYLQSERIFILPMELRGQFAYPENAELLFLWPLLFLHDARAVNMVQGLLALFGGGVVYTLAVKIGVHSRMALFVGLLFMNTPIVAGQAGSAYIDLIVSVYFLAALSHAVLFWQTGRKGGFYLAALMCGLLVGMKYSMIFFVIILQPLLFFPVLKEPKRKVLGYIGVYFALLFLGGSYWYIRNFIVLGAPFVLGSHFYN